MINRIQLLADLQVLLRRLEADLLERSEAMPHVKQALTHEHQRARTAARTAQSYEDWRADYITQMAAAWVLSGVFVRFLEDNRLIDPPHIAGPGERLARARDEHELYFRAHPTETDREYLLHVFEALANLPGTQDIFGVHNPIHELPTWLSGDAAGALLTFFQRREANTGALVHDFTDPDWQTRFLGDLYQDLSEASRKKYALLQTPEFVEEFILDRTLEPAIQEFGLAGLRLLDPTCGSGHFLLGAFQRLLDGWWRREPGTGKRELVQRALDAVYGVDVNPYAVAIARFRLEEFLPSIDLTHVIDTSGAYIPGHGTPTVILFGRHRKPISHEVRAVLGIRGEPSTPDDSAQGQVWRSIVEHLDRAGSQNEFVSVTDILRQTFTSHPWSIGGGGAAKLKELIEENSACRLQDRIEAISSLCITREDEAYLLPQKTLARRHIQQEHQIISIQGDQVRDWMLHSPGWALFPYDATLIPVSFDQGPAVHQFLWPVRELLWRRRELSGDHRELGRTWWEWNRFLTHRFRTPLSITFAFVATHNHFVLDRGGKVFNRSAPVIKLPSKATEEDHLALLGLLNSSTACFWMKQVFHNKGSTVDDKGARQTTVAFENFYEFTGTGLQKFPVSPDKPLDLAVCLDHLAQEWHRQLPSQLAARFPLSRTLLYAHREKAAALLGRMIALQEELDWRCYGLYDITDPDLCYRDVAGQRLTPPAIVLGQRAFEIVLARKMAAGELESTWFERHGSTPMTEIPAEWPEDYRNLVERRMALIETNHNIALIETNHNIALIEQPEYKRRWNTEAWESQLEQALRHWLLDRLESYFDFDGRMNDTGTPSATLDIVLLSTAHLADVARQDPDFQQVGALYRHDPAFDVHRLVAALIEAESVPLLPVLRYRDSGQRKRRAWEQTWALQRQEDAIDARTRLPADHPQYLSDVQAQTLKRQEIGALPVPPRYTSSDFVSSTCWRLRGKLDVPKERWVSFPHCNGADGTLMLAWAGYDHLQLARAISAYYVDIQERRGGGDDPRLVPLLACLLELLPWLKQWHNDVDPEFGMQMGDYFEGFVQEEARQLGKTLDQIKAWEPPKKMTRRRSKR